MKKIILIVVPILIIGAIVYFVKKKKEENDLDAIPIKKIDFDLDAIPLKDIDGDSISLKESLPRNLVRVDTHTIPATKIPSAAAAPAPAVFFDQTAQPMAMRNPAFALTGSNRL
jgi:hypothetical protein